MEKEEFESGLVEYIRKGLKDYDISVETIFNICSQSIEIEVDCKSFEEPIWFNIEEFMNKNLSFAGTMKYPNCLDMIEKDYVVVNLIYDEIYSIIKKEFGEKMNKVYAKNYEKKGYKMEIIYLHSELDKYKSLYQNLQSQLQTIKSIINKIEG